MKGFATALLLGATCAIKFDGDQLGSKLQLAQVGHPPVYITAADCTATQYYINASHECRECSSSLQGCVSCHRASSCDACEPGAKVVYLPGGDHVCDCLEGHDWESGHCVD